MEDLTEIWRSVESLRTAVAAGYVKPCREQRGTLTLAAEIDRLGAEVAALHDCCKQNEDSLRANEPDIELLEWVLAHPETCAEVLLDAAAGDGEARALLEQRRAGLAGDRGKR